MPSATGPLAMTYVTGSGIFKPDFNIGSYTGTNPLIITIPFLAAGASTSFEFKATAIDLVGTAPRLYTNTANFGYTYVRDPRTGTTQTVTNQNTNTVSVVQSNANVQITKKMYLVGSGPPLVEVNEMFADEQIQIEIATANNDGAPIAVTVIGDSLQVGLNYVAGSYKVEDIDAGGTIVNVTPLFQVNPAPPANIRFEAVPITPSYSLLNGHKLKLTLIVAVDPTNTVSPLGNTGITLFTRDGSAVPDGVKTDRLYLFVAYPSLAILKQAAPSVVKVSENIGYILWVTNTGNYPLTNVKIADVPLQALLTDGTLSYIQGYPIEIDGNPVGFTIPIVVGTLAAGETKAVAIYLNVNKDPVGNFINNTATLTGDAVLERTGIAIGENTESAQPAISSAQVEVLDLELELAKTVNPLEAGNGDTLTYSVTLTNHSNRILENVTVFDLLPAAANFIKGSVTIDTGTGPIPYPSADITKSIDIGSLPITPGPTPQIVILTYDVQIDLDDFTTIPNEITNYAGAEYTYRREPDSNPEQGFTEFVAASVVISNPVLTVSKIVTPTYVQEGDTITYIITITNQGNEMFSQVKLIDVLPVGITTVNSVSVKSGLISYPVSGNLAQGIIVIGTGLGITSLLPTQSAELTIVTTVASVPPEVFVNKATLGYTYTKNGSEITQFVDTLPAMNYGIVQSLSVIKSAVPNKAFIGDTITYTIEIQNDGTTPIADIFIQDPLNGQITLINAYTLVGGIKENVLITDGVTIPSLAPGAIIQVVFEARVIDVSQPLIQNQSQYEYYYYLDPEEKPILVPDQVSNIATVNAIQSIGALKITKSSLDQTVLDNSTYTYNLVLQNIGNRDLSSIVLTDPLTTGLQFVANSLTINGQPTAGNITQGVPIGFLAAPGTALPSSINVNFQVKVVEASPPTVYPNMTYANFTYDNGTRVGSAQSNPYSVKLATISITRNVSQTLVSVGDTVTHALKVTNTGVTPLNTVLLAESIDPRLTVDLASVRVNGQPTSGSLSSLPLPDLQPGESAFVVYNAVVNSVGNGSPITNTATTNGNTVDAKTPSAISTISVGYTVDSVFPLTAVKTVTPTVAQVGDLLAYTLIFTNTSGDDLTELSLTDLISSNLRLVPMSLTVDGVVVSGGLQNLQLPSIVNEGDTVTVAFNAEVIEGNTSGVITNQATLNYTLPDGSIQSIATNTVTTQLSQGCQDYCMDVTLELTASSLPMRQLLDIEYTVQGITPYADGCKQMILVHYDATITYIEWYGTTQQVTVPQRFCMQVDGPVTAIVMTDEKSYIGECGQIKSKALITLC